MGSFGVPNHFKSWGPNRDLVLKQLSIKALFLLTCATISRMSSLAILGREIIVNKVSYLCITPLLTNPFSGPLYYTSDSTGEAEPTGKRAWISSSIEIP